jgi:hypothetical protein
MQTLLEAAATYVFLLISLGPSLLVSGGAAYLLFAAARKFPRDSTSRGFAMAIAAVSSAACIAWVAFNVCQVYLPVIRREQGATNGWILLIGPSFMSLLAMYPVAAVWGVLSVWAKRSGAATTRCRPTRPSGARVDRLLDD